ncbi:hypothetical protein [Actinoplanes sp. NPDC051859]|uniref:hypothetical protein n=1 Tax=Actinoplanes sp. NPDC051859 TaxID=3363909 RepID=UPI0037A30188
MTWPDIDRAVVHRVGLPTVLDVTPADLDRVHPIADGSDGWPAPHDEADGTLAFTAVLTCMGPARALRRQLSWHLWRSWVVRIFSTHGNFSAPKTPWSELFRRR